MTNPETTQPPNLKPIIADFMNTGQSSYSVELIGQAKHLFNNPANYSQEVLVDGQRYLITFNKEFSAVSRWPDSRVVVLTCVSVRR